MDSAKSSLKVGRNMLSEHVGDVDLNKLTGDLRNIVKKSPAALRKQLNTARETLIGW
jgi:hypothetical protein